MRCCSTIALLTLSGPHHWAIRQIWSLLFNVFSSSNFCALFHVALSVRYFEHCSVSCGWLFSVFLASPSPVCFVSWEVVARPQQVFSSVVEAGTDESGVELVLMMVNCTTPPPYYWTSWKVWGWLLKHGFQFWLWFRWQSAWKLSHKPERRKICTLCYEHNEIEVKMNVFLEKLQCALVLTSWNRFEHEWHGRWSAGDCIGVTESQERRVVDRLGKCLHLRNKTMWHILYTLDFFTVHFCLYMHTFFFISLCCFLMKFSFWDFFVITF